MGRQWWGSSGSRTQIASRAPPPQPAAHTHPPHTHTWVLLIDLLSLQRKLIIVVVIPQPSSCRRQRPRRQPLRRLLGGPSPCPCLLLLPVVELHVGRVCNVLHLLQYRYRAVHGQYRTG